MTKTIAKQASAWLFAILVALVAALVLTPSAFADYVSAQADDDPALKVYTRTLTGYDSEGKAQYSEANLVKEYTVAELNELAEKKSPDEAPAYLMFTDSRRATTVFVADKYVLTARLLEGAGIEDVRDAALINYYNVKDGAVVLYGNTNLTGEQLLQDMKFFPNHVSTQHDTEGNTVIPHEILNAEGAVSVPTIIALSWSSFNIDRENRGTANEAHTKAIGGPFKESLRAFRGQTTEEYLKGLQMGSVSPNGVTGLLVSLNSLENATVSDIPDATYTGKAITPAVKEVSIGSKKLTEGTDYKVSYKNNVKAGTASVVITGVGEFCGTITKTFKITAAANALTGAKSKISKSFTVNKLKKAKSIKLPKVSATFGTVKWSVAKKDKKKVLKLKKGKVTVKKGAKKGTYTIKLNASVAETANYAGVSKTITVKVKVKEK